MESLQQNQIIDVLSTLSPDNTFIPSGLLSSPTETITKPDKIIYTYTSSDPSRPHIIHTQNDLITFIQITLGDARTLTIDDISSRYGKPENTAYSAHSHDSLVYSYPSKGLVFITDNTGKNILLAQQFPPSTDEEYTQTVGKNFTTQPYGDIVPTSTQAASTTDVVPKSLPSQPDYPIITVFTLIFFITFLATTFIIIRKRRKLKTVVAP